MARKPKDENEPAQAGGNGQPAMSVQERVGAITDSAEELISQGRGAVHDLASALDLRERTRKNPYAMVAAALGVGYVLGGGLFTPTTSRLLRLGMRVAALPLIKDELLAL